MKTRCRGGAQSASLRGRRRSRVFQGSIVCDDGPSITWRRSCVGGGRCAASRDGRVLTFVRIQVVNVFVSLILLGESPDF